MSALGHAANHNHDGALVVPLGEPMHGEGVVGTIPK